MSTRHSATNSPNTAGAIARITREIAQIQCGSDLSLAVACQESDVRHVRALIVGPPETPYEYGLFEFDINFGKNYPISSPTVTCITTNGGRCRFNPNIYNCGKVCLSILGTWRGEPGEEWSSAQGLESVLLSIQSLMSANPYENEPGPFERAKKDEPEPQAYIAKIRHESLRITVIQRMEVLLGINANRIPAMYEQIRAKTNALINTSDDKPDSVEPRHSPEDAEGDGTETPNTDVSVHEYDAEATYAAAGTGKWEPFADLFKRRFLWYYDSYLKTITTAKSEVKDGKSFKRMPFEGPPNSMEGKFDYAGLESRLKRIYDTMEMERACWESQGAVQVEAGTQLATQLAFQFKQLKHKWDIGSKMELHLPNPKNPFVWNLTLFGTPSSNLDGGIFSITLSIPPDFPEQQPRVKFETPMFHHRVSSTGHLCYFPVKMEDIASHLDAIVRAVEDETPTYDPRMVVNPGAFALFWGGDEKRKFYNRKLRRSAQDSSEG